MTVKETTKPQTKTKPVEATASRPTAVKTNPNPFLVLGGLIGLGALLLRESKEVLESEVEVETPPESKTKEWPAPNVKTFLNTYGMGSNATKPYCIRILNDGRKVYARQDIGAEYGKTVFLYITDEIRDTVTTVFRVWITRDTNNNSGDPETIPWKLGIVSKSPEDYGISPELMLLSDLNNSLSYKLDAALNDFDYAFGLTMEEDGLIAKALRNHIINDLGTEGYWEVKSKPAPQTANVNTFLTKSNKLGRRPQFLYNKDKKSFYYLENTNAIHGGQHELYVTNSETDTVTLIMTVQVSRRSDTPGNFTQKTDPWYVAIREDLTKPGDNTWAANDKWLRCHERFDETIRNHMISKLSKLPSWNEVVGLNAREDDIIVNKFITHLKVTRTEEDWKTDPKVETKPVEITIPTVHTGNWTFQKLETPSKESTYEGGPKPGIPMNAEDLVSFNIKSDASRGYNEIITFGIVGDKVHIGFCNGVTPTDIKGAIPVSDHQYAYDWIRNTSLKTRMTKSWYRGLTDDQTEEILPAVMCYIREHLPIKHKTLLKMT